jgi:hypothetical protein
VVYRSLRIDGDVDPSVLEAVDAQARSQDAHLVWRTSSRPARTYGLLRWATHDGVSEFSVPAGVTAYPTAIIALAVFPAVPEALPFLEQALGGPGRPAGVASCESYDGSAAIVEWDMDRTPAQLVLDLIDVECARFGGGRTAALLSPLPQAWVARLAAAGLRAPEIVPERILDVLVERAGLRA